DLGGYRPGLGAARYFGVRHPYVEAGILKAGVRLLAMRLGLGELADLPVAPCLASRVETGIRIEAASLRFIHQVERLLQRDLNPRVVRCRIRREAVAGARLAGRRAFADMFGGCFGEGLMSEKYKKKMS